jgi:hypothetical protein
MKKQEQDIIKTEKKIKIYYLHKGDNIPFYVGKTKNPNNRISGHRTKLGLNICLEIVDIVLKENAKFWESFWIEQFKQWGFKLVNKNQGGGGLESHSIQTKTKISNIWKMKSTEEKNQINIKRGIGNLGKKKSTSGYRNWKKEDLDKLKSHSPFNKPDWSDKCKKQVLMLDKNTRKILKEFNSVTEAALAVGVSQGTLSGCLIGKSKTSGGYKWEYKK